MTTEDDFQRQLDEHPEDHQTRLVFADWLDERGDPRGPGYRALGVCGLCVHCESWFNDKMYDERPPEDTTNLPYKWFVKLKGGQFRNPLRNDPVTGHERRTTPPRYATWCQFESRAHAENAAALAWSKLPESVRVEILNPVESH